MKSTKLRNDNVFEKVADAKLFQAFPRFFMHFSISDHISHIRHISHISHMSSVSSHAFRILSDPFRIFEASCLTIKERYSKIDCQWGRNCRTDGPELTDLTAASETRRSTSKYILSRPRTTLLDMVRYGC